MQTYSYVMHTDGASKGNPGTTGLGVAIYKDLPSGLELVTKLSKRIKDSTCNQAEYEALLLGLRQFSRPEELSLQVYTDSKLMAEQVSGNWKCKDPDLQLLLDEVKKYVKYFKNFKITHVYRSNNSLCDDLANQGCLLPIDKLVCSNVSEPQEVLPTVPVINNDYSIDQLFKEVYLNLNFPIDEKELFYRLGYLVGKQNLQPNVMQELINTWEQFKNFGQVGKS